MERAGQNGWQVRTHTNTHHLETGQKHTHIEHTHNQNDVLIVQSSNTIVNLLVGCMQDQIPTYCLCMPFWFPLNTFMCVNPGECYLCGEFQWGSIPTTPGGPGPTSGEEICHWPRAWETTEHLRTGNIILLTKVFEHTNVTITLQYTVLQKHCCAVVSKVIRHVNPPNLNMLPFLIQNNIHVQNVL